MQGEFKMKEKRIVGLILVMILSTVTVGTVMAQRAAPADFIESPTSISSAGRFSSGADDYIHSAYYADVEFKNWFSFASFAEANRVSMGYARRIGGIYLGLYYGGNLFMGYTTDTYTESDETTYGATKTFRAYSSGPGISTAAGYNNNRFAVLIGFGNMGIRLSYASTHDGFSGEDISYGLLYKQYDSANGWIVPQIQWGMTTTLLPQGIQPTVTLDLGFRRYFTRYEQYYTSPWTTRSEYVQNSQNYFEPTLSLGAGGYTIYTGEAFKAAVDLDYTLIFRMYSNDYSNTTPDAAGKYKVASISVLNTTGVLTEKSYIKNEVTPSIKASYSGERLGLGAKLYLPLGFESEKTTDMVRKAANDTDIWKDGDDESRFEFTFSPLICLGLQYQMIPSKLTLNAGGVITAVEFTRESTDTDSYSGGSKAAGSSTVKTRSTSFSGTRVTGLYAGFGFNLNENFGLEAVTGVGGSPARIARGSNEVNIFGTGNDSLTAFYQILATLKF